MKIFFAADHAGFELKSKLLVFVSELGHEVLDCGATDLDSGDDYTGYVAKAAREVSKNPESHLAIVIGGSGQGEAMVANRFRGVRAAVFYGPAIAKSSIDAKGAESTDPFEIVKLSKLHNNTNVLSLGARFISLEEAKQAVTVWLNTNFSGEDRHVRRIAKIDTSTDTTL